jgi:phosphoribosylanthranilate isomerase
MPHNRALLRTSSLSFLSRVVGSACLVGSVVATGACGGNAEPAAVPTAPPPAAPAAPPANLSAVPEPANLVFLARVNHPDKLLAAAGSWTSLPMPPPQTLATLMAGEELGTLVDATQAVDAAVTFVGGTKPQVDIAVAAGLLSMDDAKAKLGKKHKLVPKDNGVFYIKPIGSSDKPSASSDDDSDDDGQSCAVAPAFGPAAARLVCADSDPSLDQLLPFLTRTAPRASYGTDVHMETRTEAFKTSLEALKQLMPMALSGLPQAASSPSVFALLDAVSTDVAQLSGDVKKWTIDATATDAGLKVHSVIALQSAKSLVSETLVAHPERADAPPATFFKLPADSDSAFYSRAGDPALYDHPIKLLTAALTDLAVAGGVSAKDAKAATSALGDVLTLSSTQSVSAHGVDSDEVKRALGEWKAVEKTDSAKKEQALFELVQARIGWWVTARSVPAAKVNATFKEALAASQRPSFTKLWASTFKGVPFPRWKIGNAVKGAPAGTVHYSIEIPSFAKLLDGSDSMRPGKLGAGKGKHQGSSPSIEHTPVTRVFKPLPFHVVVVGDGDQTWFGMGCDEDIALQHLKVSLAGGSSTLASRPGLDALKNSHTTSGGFLDSHNFAGSPFIDWLSNNESAPEAASMEAVKGTTPMLFFGTATGPTPDAPAGEQISDIDVSKDAFQEITRSIIASLSDRR